MKKVTFKEFATTVWCGVWQVVRWVAGMFGYKDETWYGKIVRRIFAGCLAAIALMVTLAMGLELYDDIRYSRQHNTEYDEPSDYYGHVDYLSRNVRFDWHSHEVFNTLTEEKMKDVDWVYKSVDGDSLAVFSKKGKRGYLNRFTGKVVIQPQYSRAWIFGNGVACVEKDSKLMFIGHSGKQVFDKTFEYQHYADGYVFHDGYCLMTMPAINMACSI